MDLNIYNDTYDLFCNSISKIDASILEIGCGPGNITKYLVNQRPYAKIMAIDISENMIELARRNNPNVDFKIMDCRNISTLIRRFISIICGFSIPYLSEADCSKLISDCNDLLEEDGILYLSFMAGEYASSGYISGSTGDRTYFYFYGIEKLKKELEMNSLLLTDVIDKEYLKPDGTKEVHLIINAVKPNGQ